MQEARDSRDDGNSLSFAHAVEHYLRYSVVTLQGHVKENEKRATIAIATAHDDVGNVHIVALFGSLPAEARVDLVEVIGMRNAPGYTGGYHRAVLATHNK